MSSAVYENRIISSYIKYNGNITFSSIRPISLYHIITAYIIKENNNEYCHLLYNTLSSCYICIIIF